jgi:hypothetical protein
MGTESYQKRGQVSKKKHVAKGQGREWYLGRFDERPSLGGASDQFERRWSKNYHKQSVKPDMGDDFL